MCCISSHAKISFFFEGCTGHAVILFCPTQATKNKALYYVYNIAYKESIFEFVIAFRWEYGLFLGNYP